MDIVNSYHYFGGVVSGLSFYMFWMILLVERHRAVYKYHEIAGFLISISYCTVSKWTILNDDYEWLYHTG